MRKLIKANNSRKDSVEAYACYCTCACTNNINNKISKAVSKSTASQLADVNYK